MRRNPALWPYAALSASYFAHVGLFLPYLPLWLSDLGLPLLAISLLNAIPPATRLAAPYLWGSLADRTGQPNRVMRICVVMSAVGALGLCLGLQWGLPGLAAFLLLLFFHNSALMPMSEAAIAQQVSRSGQFDMRLYGQVRLWGSGGFLLTVLVGGAWYEYLGIEWLPWLSVLGMLVLAMCVWRLPPSAEAAHAQSPAGALGPVLQRPVVRWFFASVFFHVFSHMSVHIFLSLYLHSLGYSKVMIGVLWAFSVVVEIIWFYTQGRWLPRLSLGQWLWVCALVTVLRMGATAAFAQWLWVALLVQALHAITFAAHHTVATAFLTEHFPERLRARGQALYVITAYGIPGVLSALFGGLLSERFGLHSVFWASTGLALAALACARRVSQLARG